MGDYSTTINRVRGKRLAFTASLSSHAQRIGTPFLNRALDVGGLGEATIQHFTHESGQFGIGSKAQRDELRGSQRACLPGAFTGQQFTLAQLFFKSDDAVLDFERVEPHERCERDQRDGNDYPPAFAKPGFWKN